MRDLAAADEVLAGAVSATRINQSGGRGHDDGRRPRRDAAGVAAVPAPALEVPGRGHAVHRDDDRRQPGDTLAPEARHRRHRRAGVRRERVRPDPGGLVAARGPGAVGAGHRGRRCGVVVLRRLLAEPRRRADRPRAAGGDLRPAATVVAGLPRPTAQGRPGHPCDRRRERRRHLVRRHPGSPGLGHPHARRHVRGLRHPRPAPHRRGVPARPTAVLRDPSLPEAR